MVSRHTEVRVTNEEDYFTSKLIEWMMFVCIFRKSAKVSIEGDIRN